jgi:hypothetical protein
MCIQKIAIACVSTLSISIVLAKASGEDRTAAAFSVIRTISLPSPRPDGFWDYVSVDAESRKLFIGTQDGVLAVDVDTGRSQARFVVGALVHSILPLPNGRELSTNGTTDTAAIFDAGSGKILGTVKTGRHPDGAAYDAANGLALVMNAIGGDITLIDPEKRSAVGRVSVGGQPESGAGDGRGLVYVNVARRGEVVAVNVAQRQVVAHYPLPGCKNPTGLAIDPVEGLLIAACENKAIALHATDGRVIASLDIGRGADAVVFDSLRKLFFVPCGDDGILAVIAENPGESPTVIQTVKTAKGARTAALDPQTGRLFLPTADAGKGTFMIEGHVVPKFRPGTFRLFVVGSAESARR